tara:strand:+ start:760 stop:1056 length:297 start_codon:yes stop_codon:yes gene_type:complete
MIRVSVKGKMPDIRRKILESISEASREFIPRIKGDTPVDTGFLRSQWSRKRNRKGSTISNKADYASFVEDNQRFIEPNIEPLKRRIVDKVKRKSRRTR